MKDFFIKIRSFFSEGRYGCPGGLDCSWSRFQHRIKGKGKSQRLHRSQASEQ